MSKYRATVKFSDYHDLGGNTVEFSSPPNTLKWETVMYDHEGNETYYKTALGGHKSFCDALESFKHHLPSGVEVIGLRPVGGSYRYTDDQARAVIEARDKVFEHIDVDGIDPFMLASIVDLANAVGDLLKEFLEEEMWWKNEWD